MQGQVIADGIFPALVLLVSVIGEVLCDIIIDTIQSESLLRTSLDSHTDESYIGLTRLNFSLSPSLFTAVAACAEIMGGPEELLDRLLFMVLVSSMHS